MALKNAPDLVPLTNASFEKARTLKVYSAPSESSWSARNAQVTTDETVAIYGVEGDWVLVSYAIGNGSRGRIGYINDSQLEDPETVAELGLCSVPIMLAKDTEATDDPLRGRAPLTNLDAGEQVTLMAFMGSDWAYVEIELEKKNCRLFIPQAALMQD